MRGLKRAKRDRWIMGVRWYRPPLRLQLYRGAAGGYHPSSHLTALAFA